MTTFYLAVTILLTLMLLVSTVRIVCGPTPADRMLAAMLFGTTSVAVVVLLSVTLSQPALLDVALVVAALAAVAMVAFVRETWTTSLGGGTDRVDP